MRFIDREEVARRLTYDVCIPIVRDAMIAFSKRRDQAASADHRPALQGPCVRRHARRDGRACDIRREAHQRLPRELREGNGNRTRGWSFSSIPRPARRYAPSMPERSPPSGRPPPVRLRPMCWRAKTPADSRSSAMANRPRPTRGPSARCAVSSPSWFGDDRPNARRPSPGGCKRSSPCRSPPPPAWKKPSPRPTSSAPSPRRPSRF